MSPEDIERLTSVDTPADEEIVSCSRVVVPGRKNPRDVSPPAVALLDVGDGNAQRTQPKSRAPSQSCRTLAANPCQPPVDVRGGNPIE